MLVEGGEFFARKMKEFSLDGMVVVGGLKVINFGEGTGSSKNVEASSPWLVNGGERRPDEDQEKEKCKWLVAALKEEGSEGGGTFEFRKIAGGRVDRVC